MIIRAYKEVTMSKIEYDWSKYVSTVPEELKTLSASLVVSDCEGKILQEAEVPRGFQVDRYAMSVMGKDPDVQFNLKMTDNPKTLAVILVDGGRYRGAYTLFYHNV